MDMQWLNRATWEQSGLTIDRSFPGVEDLFGTLFGKCESFMEPVLDIKDSMSLAPEVIQYPPLEDFAPWLHDKTVQNLDNATVVSTKSELQGNISASDAEESASLSVSDVLGEVQNLARASRETKGKVEQIGNKGAFLSDTQKPLGIN